MQAGAAYRELKEKAERYETFFQKTGGLITADGSDDHLIRPEGAQNYSLAGDVAPHAAEPAVARADPDGDVAMAAEDCKDSKESKAERQRAKPAAAAVEDEDDDSASEDEAEQLFESDDEPDSDSEAQSLAQALPDGFSVVEHKPSLDSSLIGRQVVFKFNSHGWETAAIIAYYAKPRGKDRFNFELLYDGDDQRSHYLQLENYRFDDRAPAGSWCVVAPNL